MTDRGDRRTDSSPHLGQGRRREGDRQQRVEMREADLGNLYGEQARRWWRGGEGMLVERRGGGGGEVRCCWWCGGRREGDDGREIGEEGWSGR
jgi:hypothetical protein